MFHRGLPEIKRIVSVVKTKICVRLVIEFVDSTSRLMRTAEFKRAHNATRWTYVTDHVRGDRT